MRPPLHCRRCRERGHRSGRTDIRMWDESISGKRAYVACWECGDTWSTRNRGAWDLPAVSYHEVKERVAELEAAAAPATGGTPGC